MLPNQVKFNPYVKGQQVNTKITGILPKLVSI
jgi:hypothetical protein